MWIDFRCHACWRLIAVNVRRGADELDELARHGWEQTHHAQTTVCPACSRKPKAESQQPGATPCTNSSSSLF